MLIFQIICNLNVC